MGSFGNAMASAMKRRLAKAEAEASGDKPPPKPKAPAKPDDFPKTVDATEIAGTN